MSTEDDKTDIDKITPLIKELGPLLKELSFTFSKDEFEFISNKFANLYSDILLKSEKLEEIALLNNNDNSYFYDKLKKILYLKKQGLENYE